ncbi:hypothetical protein [Sphaerisporangium fuscum]|uniref:hypothetical protein n=1 Tax=Sphaerisporangium fuscum TaxID=2835868 RepID=UPI001BDC529A|nr:hypothetical protein [Sphaerisporangium fuscum]
MRRLSLTTRATGLVGSVFALTLLTGCGGGASPEAPALAAAGAAAPADAGQPLTLKELAGRTGCAKPQIQTDSDELRQGVCKTDKGQYALVTFSTDQGKRDWLTEAKEWGGNYLVGNKWVISGNDPALLQSFSQEVGGSLETTAP